MKQKKDQEFHHKRSLGQNFITDDALFAQLVDLAGVGEKDAVLEIGAGAGGMTKELSRRCRKVVAVEVDGVAPTRSNIRTGRYPFSVPRFAVFPAAPSAAAREFLRMLDSGSFAKMLEDDGELAELPVAPK